MKSGGWVQYDAYIRHFLHLDPDTLEDEKYFRIVAGMEFVFDKLGMLEK